MEPKTFSIALVTYVNPISFLTLSICFLVKLDTVFTISSCIITMSAGALKRSKMCNSFLNTSYALFLDKIPVNQ